MIQVNILGCGSSLGTPVLGCKCQVCTSKDFKNKRSRSALLITKYDEKDNKRNILIDCGFDIKNQLLKSNTTQLDAVIVTHNHADHISGLDELRIFAKPSQALPLYITRESSKKIMSTYQYLLDNKSLKENIIDYDSSIEIQDIKISFFKQDHVVMNSLGIRINNFVYANDLAFFYEESLKYLENIDIFVVDCCDYKPTKIHAGLDRVLLWHQQFQPKITYLTNLSHKIDYYKIKEILPSNIYPAYDGLVFKI